MSNRQKARPINRTSGLRQRPKHRWDMAHARFAPLGLTNREIAGALDSAAKGRMSTKIRDFLTGKKPEAPK